jgi:hypothetical protein
MLNKTKKTRFKQDFLKQFLFKTLTILAIILALTPFTYSSNLNIDDIFSSSCSLALSLDDWRVISAIGLLLSAILIAGMYMYGSVIDESFKARAKNEMFQLFFTLIILIFFSFIIQLLCSDLITDIFGLTGSSFSASYNYLSNLSSYIANGLVITGIAGSTISFLADRDIFSLFSDPISYLADSTFVIYGILLTAYIVTISQINLLPLLSILSLKFLIPIGLVLRSILPFRRFGGALLGAGIGLLLFIPLALIFNSLMFNVYISAPSVVPFQCQDNSDCFSHMCVNSQTPGLKVCRPLKADGESCNSDSECRSGYCGLVPGSVSAKQCLSCGLESSTNPLCCEGYKKGNDGKCHLLRANGEMCSSDNDCISGLCREQAGINVCVPKKQVGQECNSDNECISRSCGLIQGVKKCKQTIMNPEDYDYFSSLISNYNSVSYSIQYSQSQSTIVSGGSAPTGSFFSSLIQKVIDFVVIAFVAGILFPILNLTLISRGIRDLSSALGSEMDIASIWRIL